VSTRGGCSDCNEGLQSPSWDTSQMDIDADIIAIEAGDYSFHVILCSEVFEHIPILALH